MKEREREIYIRHINLSSHDPNFGARMLEDQAERILQLTQANEEYEKRQNLCEKKWANLFDEN